MRRDSRQIKRRILIRDWDVVGSTRELDEDRAEDRAKDRAGAEHSVQIVGLGRSQSADWR